jgi:hypothetical protein
LRDDDRKDHTTGRTNYVDQLFNSTLAITTTKTPYISTLDFMNLTHNLSSGYLKVTKATKNIRTHIHTVSPLFLNFPQARKPNVSGPALCMYDTK